MTLDELKYDPETGHITNNGKRCGTITKRGYRRIKVSGKSYRSGRLAWYLKTGKWPEHEVDHDNRVRDDDRWSNLKAATHKENCNNRGVRMDNKLGVKGVYRKGKKYAAKRGRKHLGTFATIAEAKEAYDNSI